MAFSDSNIGSEAFRIVYKGFGIVGWEIVTKEAGFCSGLLLPK